MSVNSPLFLRGIGGKKKPFIISLNSPLKGGVKTSDRPFCIRSQAPAWKRHFISSSAWVTTSYQKSLESSPYLTREKKRIVEMGLEGDEVWWHRIPATAGAG
jgi:hypothetical protein